MKATIEIPDDLYRQVKAKSALEGKRIRDVTIELYLQWLGRETAKPSHSEAAKHWLEGWLSLADEAIKESPIGPAAREILEQDRGRLDRKA